jgi:glycosyltransferase involved in cell wall biosynthesis
MMQMAQQKPLVSIGVPVYNDAPWLRNALDHLVAQDYTNLEIILADDGSIDGSREICRGYAQRDARIRLFENKHNLGTIGNHQFVFNVSTGDYFAWGSGHDYYMPSFISRMLEALEENPSVVQCCSKSFYVYDDGEFYRPPGLLDTRGVPAVERIKTLIDFRAAGGTADYYYGLYRSEFLEKVDIARDSVNTDAIMLAELSFLGELLQIDEPLLYKISTRGRVDVRATRESFRTHLDKLRLSQGTILKEFLPRFNSFVEYMNMFESVSKSASEKEYLFHVIKAESARYTPAITREIQYFLQYFSAEMPTLKSFPRFRSYHAAQILNVLELVRLFGFEHEGLHELRSICLSGMGLQAEARVAAREERKLRWVVEKMQMVFGRYRLKAQMVFRQYRPKVSGLLHKLVGDKMWHLLRRILYDR